MKKITAITKKITVAALAVLTLMGGLPFASLRGTDLSALTTVNASAANTVLTDEAQGITFSVGSTIKITGWNSDIAVDENGRYTVPTKLFANGTEYTVTGIGNGAFKNCELIKELTIPEGITSIGENSFAGCKQLKKVYFNAPSCKISSAFSDYVAFNGCSSLTEFVFGEAVKEIPSNVCTNLSTLSKVTFLGNVTKIGGFAFQNCAALKSVDISNVTEIGNYAFNGCSGFKEITIPESMKKIGDAAFRNCGSLEKVYFNAPECKITGSSSDYAAFGKCAALTVFVFGKKVTAIPAYVFSRTESVEKVYFTGKVTEIKNFAFYCSPEIADIYTFGSKNDWDKMTVGTYNEAILNANIHFCVSATFNYNGKTVTEIGEENENLSAPADVEKIGYDFNGWSPAFNGKFPGNSTVYTAQYSEKTFTLNDNATGSSVTYDYFAYSEKENLTLEVNDVTDNGEHSGSYVSDSGKNYPQIVLYDIRLVDSEGMTVNPLNGKKVTVSLRLPAGYASRKDISIIHWTDNAAKEVFSLANKNLTFENGCAVFQVSSFSEFSVCLNPATASIRNMSKYNGKAIDYKSTITFFANLENCTDIEWYINGRKVAANADGSCTVTQAKEDIEVHCTAKDANGNTVKSETENITVKHGFFDKLIAFFRGLFNSLPIITQ